MGLKSEVVVGLVVFFMAMRRAFFQAEGKIPFKSDVLKNLTRIGPIIGSDLAITPCGMLSVPVAWDLKWATARITSLRVISVNVKPSSVALAIRSTASVRFSD